MLVVTTTVAYAAPTMPTVTTSASRSMRRVVSSGRVSSLMSSPSGMISVVVCIGGRTTGRSVSSSRVESLVRATRDATKIDLSRRRRGEVVGVIGRVGSSSVSRRRLEDTIAGTCSGLRRVKVNGRRMGKVLRGLTSFTGDLFRWGLLVLGSWL